MESLPCFFNAAITAAARFGVHIWFFSITTSTCIRVCDCLSDETSCDTLLQCLDGLLTIHECLDLHIRNLRLIPAAVLLADDRILGYVYQTSGQGNQSRQYAEPYRTYLFELRVRR